MIYNIILSYNQFIFFYEKSAGVEKRRDSICQQVFFIFSCLKLPSWLFWKSEVGWQRGTLQPDTPHSPTSESRPWLLALTRVRHAHRPVQLCMDIWASSWDITKLFPAERRQWVRSCPSPAAPDHPSGCRHPPRLVIYCKADRTSSNLCRTGFMLIFSTSQRNS